MKWWGCVFGVALLASVVREGMGGWFGGGGNQHTNGDGRPVLSAFTVVLVQITSRYHKCLVMEVVFGCDARL